MTYKLLGAQHRSMRKSTQSETYQYVIVRAEKEEVLKSLHRTICFYLVQETRSHWHFSAFFELLISLTSFVFCLVRRNPFPNWRGITKYLLATAFRMVTLIA